MNRPITDIEPGVIDDFGVRIEIPERLAGRATCRVRDLTEAFGLSKPKVFEFIKDGRLDAFKIDNCLLITIASLERLLGTAARVRR